MKLHLREMSDQNDLTSQNTDVMYLNWRLNMMFHCKVCESFLFGGYEIVVIITSYLNSLLIKLTR